MNMLKPTLYYLQLILLAIFSIPRRQLKEPGDYRAGKGQQVTESNSFILQMKADMENCTMFPRSHLQWYLLTQVGAGQSLKQ